MCRFLFLTFLVWKIKKKVSGKKWNLGLLNSFCNTKLSQNYFVLLKIDAHSLYHYLKTFPIFNTFIDIRKKRKKRSVFLATHWNFMFWFFNHQTKIQFKFYANSDNFFFAICFAYIKKKPVTFKHHVNNYTIAFYFNFNFIYRFCIISIKCLYWVYLFFYVYMLRNFVISKQIVSPNIVVLLARFIGV